MGDCDNTNCCYYLDGKCNGTRDGYTIENCDEHFVDNDTVGTGEDEDYEDYVVKKNEGPWSVVNNIFGKRSDWEAIAKANGLWDKSHYKWKKLHPGQVIRIKK